MIFVLCYLSEGGAFTRHILVSSVDGSKEQLMLNPPALSVSGCRFPINEISHKLSKQYAKLSKHSYISAYFSILFHFFIWPSCTSTQAWSVLSQLSPAPATSLEDQRAFWSGSLWFSFDLINLQMITPFDGVYRKMALNPNTNASPDPLPTVGLSILWCHHYQ